LLLTTIRAGLISMTPIPIAAYSIPDVRIAKLPHMTARQSELLKQWEKGN